MGEVRTKARISNPIRPDTEPVEIDGLVDTGAVMVMLPEDVIHKLEIPINGRAVVTLANEKTEEVNVAGPISISVMNRKMHCDCLVGPALSEPLVGHLVLEGLDLIVDCQKQHISFRPQSPAYPSYKLK